MTTATSFWAGSSQVMKRRLYTLSQNQPAVIELASQWISLQDEIHADYFRAESEVHGVLGQTGSNLRRQTPTTQEYISCSHGMTNVSKGGYVKK